MSTEKRKPLGRAMEEFVFGTKETLPVPPEPEAASPAPTPTATLITETPPKPEAVLPALTAPGPFAPAAEPVPAPSEESSLAHRLQAPDSRSNGQVYGGYVRNSAPQTVGAGSQDGAQESGYCVDAVGGWFERGGRLKAIVLARIKVVESFSKTSESCSGQTA